MIKTIEKYLPKVQLKISKELNVKTDLFMHIIMNIIQYKVVTTKIPFKTLFIQYIIQTYV